MTKTQQRTAKWVIVALFAVAAVLGSIMLNSLAPVPGEAQPSSPTSAYLKYEIQNRTGSEVCGLNVHFESLDVSVNQAVEHVAPFTRITPTDQHNRVAFSGGCLQAEETATLQFAPGMGMGAMLYSYSWIKTGDGMMDLLIPGSFDGVFKEIVQPRRPMAVFAPQEDKTLELPTTTFTFELAAMPKGRLLVTQDMVIYEGQPVGVTNQELMQELTTKLNNLQNNAFGAMFTDKQQLQAELDSLTVYSPFSGQVKHIQVDIIDGTTRVTLELASLDAMTTDAPTMTVTNP
jgi:hypothetical protein